MSKPEKIRILTLDPPPYRLKARSLENHQNDIKTLILRADNSARNAPFVLKLDLRQLFMNIHRTKHGF